MVRIMNARNFRREFMTVGEEVMVVSRERLLGTWKPGSTGSLLGFPVNSQVVSDVARDLGHERMTEVMTDSRALTQAERDAILRKINRKP